MTDWEIRIEQRGDLYGCTVSVLPKRESCKGGLCSSYSPAYSRAEVVQTVREKLDEIRDGLWKQSEKPIPRPANTELVDDTEDGAFSMGDFFETGTLDLFL